MRRTRVLAILTACFLALSAARTSLAQAGDCPGAWTARGTGPSPRTAHGMAYDAARGQTLVFGGTGDIFGSTNFGDLWGWNGALWTRLSPGGPAPRRDGVLAYDSARQRTVLFGGTDTELITGNRYFPETWEWDGVRWTQRAATGPEGRNAHAMAYDAARQRVVLFGGGADHASLPADVWEWDGTGTWTRIPATGPGPGFRLSPLLAYDARRQRVVLHGGFDPARGVLRDTWEWDGALWTLRDVRPPEPAGRTGGALAFDAKRGVIVLFGGADATETAIPGVLELDDEGWRPRENGTAPQPRIGPGLAFDTFRDRLVLFGGITRAAGAFGDTWEREAPLAADRLVPIVLDVRTDTARFTTELTLTNRSDRDLEVALAYTGSIGTALHGSIRDRIPARRQLLVPDALDYLRSKGVAIPPSTQASQGGTLLVSFGCAADASAVSVVARTTTPTRPPLPEGAAGLAYGDVPLWSPYTRSPDRLVVPGLRVDAADRSNVAVYSLSSEPVRLRITAQSGAGGDERVVIRDSVVVPPYGWSQYVFGSTGLTNGRVLVERVSGNGAFGAYGVVNDNVTNDGSFVVATAPVTEARTLLVPVLVETSRFQSELVLSNGGAEPVTLELSYRESLGPAGSGTVQISLAPFEQRILPSAIDELRRRGLPLGDPGPSRAGALLVRAVSGSLASVWCAARTAAAVPGGGQFGLFTPAVPVEGAPLAEGILDGLQATPTTRSNAAFVNTGIEPVVLEAQVWDSVDGQAKGDPRQVRLESGAWLQIDNVLGLGGVSNGWLRIRHVSGRSPWFAYGVLNDGASPGERTGDGAYVVMTH